MKNVIMGLVLVATAALVAVNHMSSPQEHDLSGRKLSSVTTSFRGPSGPKTVVKKADMLNTCPNVHLSTTDEMTLNEFIDKTIMVLSGVIRDRRPLEWVAQNFDHLSTDRGAIPDGSWTEFGVFSGATLELARNKLLESKTFKGVIAGFDSFEGLPTKWRNGFDAGRFSKPELYEEVRNRIPKDVELYKGWFQDTIGQFIVKHPQTPATLVHHDGDLFISTAITFSLMNRFIVPGTILCFDELMGYPGYESHEILSLFLWMKEQRATLCPLAVKGPFTEQWKNPIADIDPHEQSACFQVLALYP